MDVHVGFCLTYVVLKYVILLKLGRGEYQRVEYEADEHPENHAFLIGSSLKHHRGYFFSNR